MVMKRNPKFTFVSRFGVFAQAVAQITFNFPFVTPARKIVCMEIAAVVLRFVIRGLFASLMGILRRHARGRTPAVVQPEDGFEAFTFG